MLDPRTLCVATIVSLFGLLATTSLEAQVDPDYTMKIESARVQLDGSTDLRITLDSTGDPIQGWSFGVCHDVTRLGLTAITPGNVTQTVKKGEPADFVDIAEYSGGFTAGVLVCLIGCASLGTGENAELFIASYDELTGVVGETDVCFCDHLGVPPVETLLVVAGESITPITECGTVEVVDQPPFRYSIASSFGQYSPADGTGFATVDLSMVEVEPAGLGLSVTAFSMGIENDPQILTPISIEVTGVIAALQGGVGPDFAGANLHSNGATIGTVFSLSGAEVLHFPTESTVVRVEYQTVAHNLIGNELGQLTTVEFSNQVGSPAVENEVVVGSASLSVELTESVIDLAAVLAAPFLRGDCNNDTSPNIADGVWLLNYLFVGGPASDCLAACDTDGDLELGLLDAVLLIQHWIIGGPPPAAPYPNCGADEEADCETYPGCTVN